MNQTQIIRQLAKRKKKTDLSFATIGRAAGMSSQACQYIFRGDNGTSPQAILAMARCLGLKVRHIPERYELEDAE